MVMSVVLSVGRLSCVGFDWAEIKSLNSLIIGISVDRQGDDSGATTARGRDLGCLKENGQ